MRMRAIAHMFGNLVCSVESIRPQLAADTDRICCELQELRNRVKTVLRLRRWEITQCCLRRTSEQLQWLIDQIQVGASCAGARLHRI